MEQLSPRQAEIVGFIQSYMARYGMAPSFNEIQQALGFRSINSVTRYIKGLQEEGILEYRRGTKRGIRLSDACFPAARHLIPLVGTIAAGGPIEAVENVEAHLELKSFGFDNRDNDTFALRVRGDSMINRGIFSGDVVIIRKQTMVGRRDVAAVRIGDTATLKYVHQQENRILLIPDNDAMKPIEVVPGDGEVEVLGKVVGLVRREV